MCHAGAVLGGLMMMHGGFNTEAKIVLDDFNLFDFDSQSWIRVHMTTH
jgi:hypothetical protein